jgi:hypothetical protein
VTGWLHPTEEGMYSRELMVHRTLSPARTKDVASSRFLTPRLRCMPCKPCMSDGSTLTQGAPSSASRRMQSTSRRPAIQTCVARMSPWRQSVAHLCHVDLGVAEDTFHWRCAPTMHRCRVSGNVLQVWHCRAPQGFAGPGRVVSWCGIRALLLNGLVRPSHCHIE